MICGSSGRGRHDCPKPGNADRPRSGSLAKPSTTTRAPARQAEAPTLRKEVAARRGAECQSAAYTLTEEPVYSPGDRVCWQITLEFPSHVETKGSTLTDFIPTHGIFDESFNGGKGEAATENDTLPDAKFTTKRRDRSRPPKARRAASAGSSPDPEYQPAKAVFQRQIATEATIHSSSKPGELQGNLVTFNTKTPRGEVFSLRASADFKLEYPELTIAKSIVAVNGKRVGPTSETSVAAR